MCDGERQSPGGEIQGVAAVIVIAREYPHAGDQPQQEPCRAERGRLAQFEAYQRGGNQHHEAEQGGDLDGPPAAGDRPGVGYDRFIGKERLIDQEPQVAQCGPGIVEDTVGRVVGREVQPAQDQCAVDDDQQQYRQQQGESGHAGRRDASDGAAATFLAFEAGNEQRQQRQHVGGFMSQHGCQRHQRHAAQPALHVTAVCVGGGLQPGKHDQAPNAERGGEQVGTPADPGDTVDGCGVHRIERGRPECQAIGVAPSRQQVASEGIESDYHHQVQQYVLEMKARRAVTPQGPADTVGQQGQRLPAAGRAVRLAAGQACLVSGTRVHQRSGYIGEGRDAVPALQDIFAVGPHEVSAE